ncbi:hypothetical protein GCM10009657_18990 [Oryzihumus leptocrescens]
MRVMLRERGEVLVGRAAGHRRAMDVGHPALIHDDASGGTPKVTVAPRAAPLVGKTAIARPPLTQRFARRPVSASAPILRNPRRPGIWPDRQRCAPAWGV